MTSLGRGRVALALAALLFSTGGAAIKGCSLSGWQVACLRSGVAALCFLAAFPDARAGLSARAWLVGLPYAATLVLFVCANKLTTAANTIFLQSTAILWLVLLGPLVLRERIGRRDGIAVLVTALGLALILLAGDASSATASDPRLGNALAAASGLTWALTLVGLRSLRQSEAGGRDAAGGAVIAGNSLAFAAALPMAWPLPALGAADGALILYLGAIQIALAYRLATTGLRSLPAVQASLILTVEPALNPLWAWAVQGERPTGLALAGGAAVVLAATWHALPRPRAPVPPAPG